MPGHNTLLVGLHHKHFTQCGLFNVYCPTVDTREMGRVERQPNNYALSHLTINCLSTNYLTYNTKISLKITLLKCNMQSFSHNIDVNNIFKNYFKVKKKINLLFIVGVVLNVERKK